MIEQGKEYEITIEDMSHEGQGIGRIEGLAVFVDGAVVGDVVKAELTKLKKSYAFGRLTEILTPSEYRVSAACEYFGSCGGCSLQSMNYEGQLKLKQKLVKDKLTRIGGIENPLVHDTIGMDTPQNYRNKAQFPVGMKQRGKQSGKPSVGFYQAKSHQIINCETCMIQSAPAEKIAQALREYMKTDHITAYDETTGKGLIRHLIVKTAFGTGEVMAILVINGKGLPNGEKLVLMMDDAINELAPDPQTGV
ncbi:MAG: rlmD, partial [Bacillota bacterium]|nr:rlmD [Bacillota bacterium]